jgi:hypothetical protein
MAKPWIDQAALKERLSAFFTSRKDYVTRFGSTVNQTFEAFVFAALVAWYKKNDWRPIIIHPTGESSSDQPISLKFSTRGKPSNYSYVSCKKEGREIHIRHQLRVATYYHDEKQTKPANLCLDVAVYRATDLSGYSTDTALANSELITFGEAKHMSAFAELIASFVGVVHELQPERLKRKFKSKNAPLHPSPFLYVSGSVNPTAEGIWQTILRRRMDIDLFHSTNELVRVFGLKGPTIPDIDPIKTPTSYPESTIPF